LLAQQRRQIGHGPDENSLSLQILDQQRGNERGLDLEFQSDCGNPHEGLHSQALLKSLSGEG
jgi:hypothetical protein